MKDEELLEKEQRRKKIFVLHSSFFIFLYLCKKIYNVLANKV